MIKQKSEYNPGDIVRHKSCDSMINYLRSDSAGKVFTVVNIEDPHSNFGRRPLHSQMMILSEIDPEYCDVD